MSERYPGGVISKTPPVVTPPVSGEGGSASGVWTLDTVLEYEKTASWPKPLLPLRLYTWGDNLQGQLGHNNRIRRSSPVQVGALTDWQFMATGYTFAAAIKTDGTLWSWGYNSQGQLGHNNTIRRSSPVQVGALTNWSKVAAARFHTLAIKTDGTLWAWGRNLDGQLGNNLREASRLSPIQIGALTNWSEVSNGDAHSVAIRTDGTLWSWGNSGFGQVGDNSLISRSSPVQIGTGWLKVSAGTVATAAIKTNGTLWSWGRSNEGQVGDNAVINRSSPVQIGALTTWAQVSRGAFHCLALRTNGTLWSWGQGLFSGALGDGFAVDRSSPVQIGALTDWVQISGGNRHSAALRANGTLWTWGDNFRGALGHNNRTYRSSPVQVGALTTWSTLGQGSRRSFTAAIIKG